MRQRKVCEVPGMGASILGCWTADRMDSIAGSRMAARVNWVPKKRCLQQPQRAIGQVHIQNARFSCAP